jgi:hypothetical protein
MDEWQLKAKIVEWLQLRGEVSALEKNRDPERDMPAVPINRSKPSRIPMGSNGKVVNHRQPGPRPSMNFVPHEHITTVGLGDVQNFVPGQDRAEEMPIHTSAPIEAIDRHQHIIHTLTDLKNKRATPPKVKKAETPMHEDIVAGVKTPFLLHEHSGPVPHDHPHRELAAKFVADVWKKNKYEGMRMSKKYLGIGEGGKADPGMGPTYGKMDTKKSMTVDPAGISDPMQHNRLDSNTPKISNSPNKINPFRNIMKSLQKRSQR